MFFSGPWQANQGFFHHLKYANSQISSELPFEKKNRCRQQVVITFCNHLLQDAIVVLGHDK